MVNKVQTNEKLSNNSKHVILIHGLHQSHWIMKLLAKRLEQAGYISHTFDYYSLLHTIEQHSEKLNTWINTQVPSEESFHIVSHSLGGLVTRDFIARFPYWLDNHRIGRCVTLGTPHLGSTTADYVKRFFPPAVTKAYAGALDGNIAELADGVCLGVIAGNKPHGLGQPILQYHNHARALDDEDKIHDGTVYLSETMLPNATDHIILPVTHTGMLVDKNVAEQTIYFLQNGKFNRQED